MGILLILRLKPIVDVKVRMILLPDYIIIFKPVSQPILSTKFKITNSKKITMTKIQNLNG
ncbi:MAG: hypothetical protein A2663_01985 [Candidatus Buchananbacteria bacterium RIFCSPHIGHO2_01_FULL_46_12]|uniref:Uncharacterized protein n=1 Tax=Candidatus Buchananbacteria bacterium RIFCSPHIGHO2_01_FULL_46_12 TaxID=1797536 RepID=A0A1G1Y585_9BACT|nr:MAG: hypothetical protein A2663_01985 [Candidatus Buchananbacteria bacterium RIFCSPHIGHO2_01_FULL_46_12]